MKYDRYKILHPSGEWESFRIPRFFNTSDVAKHCSHSTVCMFIPKGYRLFGTNVLGQSVKIEGPCWTVWNREKQEHVGPFEDVEALPYKTLWKAEGPQVPGEVAAVLSGACGHWGSGAEYLHNTVLHLEEHGIHDSNLWHLQTLVAERIRGACAESAA